MGEERSDTRPLSGLMGLTTGPARSVPGKAQPVSPAAVKRTGTLVMTPEDHAASPPPVGVSSERVGSVGEEDDDVSTLVSAASEPAEEPPTQPREVAPARFTIPPDALPDASDPEPQDTEPVAAGDAPETVVIVNGANTDERLECEVVRVTQRHLYVTQAGAMRRISRAAGFEHPPGGSWSAWRLSGRDRRRWQTEPD